MLSTQIKEIISKVAREKHQVSIKSNPSKSQYISCMSANRNSKSQEDIVEL